MSGLWTPGGQDEPEHPSTEAQMGGYGSGAEGAEGPSQEELAAAREQLRKVREELSATPVSDIVANHAIGLWQLAVLHLGLDDEAGEAKLPEAKLAVDAMAALVEGVADRLGEHREPLQAALTNVRLAYVRVSEDAAAEAGETTEASDTPETD